MMLHASDGHSWENPQLCETRTSYPTARIWGLIQEFSWGFSSFCHCFNMFYALFIHVGPACHPKVLKFPDLNPWFKFCGPGSSTFLANAECRDPSSWKSGVSPRMLLQHRPLWSLWSLCSQRECMHRAPFPQLFSFGSTLLRLFTATSSWTSSNSSFADTILDHTLSYHITYHINPYHTYQHSYFFVDPTYVSIWYALCIDLSCHISKMMHCRTTSSFQVAMRKLNWSWWTAPFAMSLIHCCTD